MAQKKRSRLGALTAEEKRVVKALISEGMRHQDIQALINKGRNATINSARITEVKKNASQKTATDKELELFKLKKQFHDPETGLNDIEHERLIRAREAMMMAVDIFNSPHLKFRTELFAVLANIAWTYLLHEYFEKKLKKDIHKKNGDTVSLYEICGWPDCPLPAAVVANLRALKAIRDEVEHKVFGKSDSNWLGLFQACCVNFENTLCELFGSELSLQNKLGFAIQFSRISLDQIAESQELSVPANIRSLDVRLNEPQEESLNDSAEYKFQIVYTLDNASKSRANIRFISPESAEGEQIHNILVKTKTADEIYPFKPLQVVKAVQKKVPGFSTHTHQLAWKKHDVRPLNGSKDPSKTKREYCIYHAAHKDYTYSKKWVDFLIKTYGDAKVLEKLRKG